MPDDKVDQTTNIIVSSSSSSAASSSLSSDGSTGSTTTTSTNTSLALERQSHNYSSATKLSTENLHQSNQSSSSISDSNSTLSETETTATMTTTMTTTTATESAVMTSMMNEHNINDHQRSTTNMPIIDEENVNGNGNGNDRVDSTIIIGNGNNSDGKVNCKPMDNNSIQQQTSQRESVQLAKNMNQLFDQSINCNNYINNNYHVKTTLPHWSYNVTHFETMSIAECPIGGGSDYGQMPFFTQTNDLILEIDDIQVAGLTSSDIAEIIGRQQAHHFRIVPLNCGLPGELREYLSRRFARGSIDHKLQEIIRENVYSRTVPCTTRPPRSDEVDNVDYKFMSVEQFNQMERSGLLLESGFYQGHHYGTPLPTSSNNKRNGTNMGIGDGINDEYQLNDPQSTQQRLTSSQQSLVSKRRRNRSNLVAIDSSTLPHGWERISDTHYGVYYIDHINKRTQYERPYECELMKGVSGFGFTLIEIDKGLVVVKSLIQGGPAQASGIIQSGDVLVSVGGMSVSGLQHSDIAHLFSTFNVGDRVRLTFARGFQLPLGFNDEDYDIITLKIVKGLQGFGFTISEGHNGQKVKKILDLERCCALRQGDILLSINGIDMSTLTHVDVVETLKQCPMDEPTEFMIKRKKIRFGSLRQSNRIVQLDHHADQMMMDANSTMSIQYRTNRQQPPPLIQNTASSEMMIPSTMNNNPNNGNQNYSDYYIDDQMGLATDQYANQCMMMPYDSVNDPIYGSNIQTYESEYGLQHQQQQQQQQQQKFVPQIAVTKAIPSPKISINREPSPTNEMLFLSSNEQPTIEYDYMQIQLARSENGFGFRIIGGSEENTIVSIGSIVPGGVAFMDGQLKAGDQIVTVNDHNVLGASHQDVVQLISQTGSMVRIGIRRKRYLNAYDITLHRQEYEGFGFVIISCGNCALIGRIIEGTPAHRCQRLHIRDRIIAVNGADVTTLSHPEIVNKIKESGETLHLRIIPGDVYSVDLIRGPNGYGFSIRGGAEFNGMPLFILAIAPNGPASTLLNIGDEIMEINEMPTTGMTHSHAVRLIGQSIGTVKLKIRRNTSLTNVTNGPNGIDAPNGGYIGAIGESRVSSPINLQQ